MAKVAILFDFDDTLVETWQPKWAQHQEVALRFYGRPLDEAAISAHWGKPSKELVQHFYGSDQPVEQMLENFHSLDSQYPKVLMPATLSVLSELSARGYVLGIVSNGRKASVSLDIERLRIPRKHFEFVHAYEDTRAYKPDPRAFELALSVLQGMDISDVVYVGDSLSDLEASRSAGVAFVGVTSGLTNRKSFVRAGASRVVDNLDELLDVF